MIGRRLLHYEILEKLGEGGMGVVYKARDTHLQRFVAIKVLPPEKVADADRKARFVLEAKAASALNHPNIITIHDISTDGDVDFIVMEHVGGRTLDQLIPRKGMRLRETLRVAVPIADALARAHNVGIIHRDLKPANIMVDDRGQVKVLDFGLAKLSESFVSEDATTALIGAVTGEGAIVGTPAYMSPEQAEGKPLDARSDVFSFGSVLYEMVTGHRAFQGESRISILAAVLQKEPAALPDDLHPELRKIIGRCLRKDPDRRIRHMEDLRLALEDLTEESESGVGGPGVAAKPSRRRTAWISAGVLGFAAVMGVGLWAWLGSDGRAEPGTGVQPRPFTAHPGKEVDPTFSPDGNQIAFTWDGENQHNDDIYSQSMDAAQPMRLTTNPAQDSRPAWSPDGRWIAFIRTTGSGNDLMLIAPGGLGEKRVKRFPLNVHPSSNWVPPIAWTPDSRNLVVSLCEEDKNRCSLFLQPSNGDQGTPLTHPPPGNYGDFIPSISSDGTDLAFARFAGGGTGEIMVLALGKDFKPNGEARQILGKLELDGHLAWLPDRHELLFFSRERMWRTFTDGKAMRRPVEFGEDLYSWSSPAFSWTGESIRMVYARQTYEMSIRRASVNETPGREGTSQIWIDSTRNEDTPQYSPDGERVCFTSNRSGYWEVWDADASGGNAMPRTSLRKWCNAPRWSPDGTQILFESNADGGWEIYVMSADGGRPNRLTTHHALQRWMSGASWSRDGKWVYFASPRSGDIEIWRISSSGGEPTQVTKAGGHFALESLDGQTLYYTKSRSGPLWKMPLNGGPEEEVLPSVPARGFVPWSDGVYFLPGAEAGSNSKVMFYSYASKAISTRSGALGRTYGSLTVSPDGRHVLFAHLDRSGTDLMLVENFR